MAISSPLLGAFNNIVNINRSKSAMNSTRSSFNNFLNFMEIETKRLEAIKLPEERKIKNLQTLNIASTFGRPGSLLSSLFSGALDVGGFLGNMFGGKEKSPKAGKPIPKAKGIRLGGLKAVGIANAVFAGLDFATGLAEGESVGKAASGAGGALAGSLLGGAIGQTLIPIPGLGFVIGSMAGNFLGGYLADRGYEAATGEKSVKEKTRARLRTQEKKQREEAAAPGTTFADVTGRFDQVVSNFERFAYTGFANMMNAAAAATGEEQNLEMGAEYPDEQQGSGEVTGEYEDVMAEGGTLPSSTNITSGFKMRYHPVTGQYKMHYGNDYAGAGAVNKPISIIQPGKVVFAGAMGTAGNAVVIDHPDGTTTKYFHLADNSIKVKVGEQLEPGRVIGTVGSTGRSTGPHLHFEVWRNGKAQDPTADADRYFRFGGNVKVKSKPGGSSNAPVAILMAGTNDADANTAAANVKRSIEELKAKGYRVVVVPPSQQSGSKYKSIGAAVEKAAVSAGAEVRNKTYKGAGDDYPYAHLDENSVTALKKEFPNARVIGDSNAESFAGSMNYRGQPSAKILDAVRTLPSVRAQGGPEEDAAIIESMIRSGSTMPTAIEQFSEYPLYNIGSNKVVLIPIIQNQGGGSQRPMVISGGNGGQQIMIPGGSSKTVLLNNMVKSLLLTNLSGS